MTRVAILTVGDEILAGDITDRNAHWFTIEVGARGHRVTSIATVGDTVDEVRAAVLRARDDCDLLLVTGGLGPTRDDLTRDGVAAALGLGLTERPELIVELEQRMQGRPLTPGSRRQCEMPDGALVLANPRGTAPGFLVRDGRFAVACFPGVPSEMHPMARALLAAELPRGERVVPRKILLCGLPESEAGARIDDLMVRGRTDLVVGITAHLGILCVSVRGDDEALVARACADAVERLGSAVFAVDDGSGLALRLGGGRTERAPDVTALETSKALATTVVRMLVTRGLTVACAESCTGGLLVGSITSVPGSSDVLHESVVTYANAAKVARLGVAQALLDAHGAVSEEVARAMAEGMLARSDADCALSVTGIAGPGGGTPEKPVGLVWFALAARDGRPTSARSVSWKGGRAEIRARSVHIALDLLRRRLLED